MSLELFLTLLELVHALAEVATAGLGQVLFPGDVGYGFVVNIGREPAGGGL